MNVPGVQELGVFALVFLRVSACFMIMPGFAGAMIPMRVRLFVALAMTLIVGLAVGETLRPALDQADAYAVSRLAIGETTTGFLIGLMARLFFLAFETLLNLAMTTIGLNSLFASYEPGEHGVAGVSLISLATLYVVVVNDWHLEVVRGLVESYEARGVVSGFNSPDALDAVTHLLTRAFMSALQIASPLVVYGVTMNVAFGLLNRMAPQLSAYFLSVPFTVAGGLVLLYLLIKGQVGLFAISFAEWFARG